MYGDSVYSRDEQDVINIITDRTMDPTGPVAGLIDSAGVVLPEGGGDDDQRVARRDISR